MMALPWGARVSVRVGQAGHRIALVTDMGATASSVRLDWVSAEGDRVTGEMPIRLCTLIAMPYSHLPPGSRRA